MKSCPFCLAGIPSEAQKCKHCGEWVDSKSQCFSEAEPSVCTPPSKALSRYNFGEKAFLTGLLSFFIPPMVLIAIGLGVAGLLRQNRGDSAGWAIAGIVLGGIALLGWIAYAATMFALHSR